MRWIYDKPAFPKPPLGKPPEFLNENAIQIPTRSHANRAVALLKSGSTNAGRAVDDYFSILAESLEAFRIPVEELGEPAFDDAIIQNIESFLPYRDEFITVVSAFSRYWRVDDDRPLPRLFEKLIPYMFRPKSLMSYQDWYWDNFSFIVHEMFLYAISFLLKQERFDAVLELMSQNYYVADALDDLREPMQPFSVMRRYMQSLEHRNRRLKLNRLSVRADMLEQRSHTSGLPFVNLMQADFVLFFYEAITSYRAKKTERWWPETLVYYRDYGPPFEIFARAESLNYFRKISPLIAVKNKTELGEMIELFGIQNAPIRLPYWNYHPSISLQTATSWTLLSTPRGSRLS
ncbi:MAG: hypothetical protein U1E81_15815 [Xanthobacteraceae bacterium]